MSDTIFINQLKPYYNGRVNNLQVDGNELIQGNLQVNGTVQLANVSVTNLTVTNDAGIGHNLTVTNDALVSHNLTITNDELVSHNLTVTNDIIGNHDVTVANNLLAPTIFQNIPGATGILLPNVGALNNSAFNYYEQYNNPAFTFVGPWAAPHQVLVTAVRVGATVTIEVSSFSFTNTGANTINSSTKLPSEFRPNNSGGAQTIIRGFDNAYTYGLMTVDPTGGINFYKTILGDGFTSVGNLSGIFGPCQISYTLN